MRNRVPRIVRRAVIMIDSARAVGKLHCMGLAHEDHARRSELAHHGGILSCNIVRQQVRAGGCRRALHIEEVLCRVGNAAQDARVRAASQRAFRSVGLRQGAFGHDVDECVQPCVERVDAAEQFFGDLYGTETASADASGQAGDGFKCKRGVGHGYPLNADCTVPCTSPLAQDRLSRHIGG